MALLKLAEAEKKWKKVKPMTMTKTGVSEILRKLKNYDQQKMTVKDCSFWLPQLNATMKDLDKALKQDRIKKNKKVSAYLADVARSLSAGLGSIDTCLGLEKKLGSLCSNTMSLTKDALANKDSASAKKLVDNIKQINKQFNAVVGVLPQYFDFQLIQKSVHVENSAASWMKHIAKDDEAKQKKAAAELAKTVSDWKKLAAKYKLC